MYPTLEDLKTRIITWAEEDERIRAVILVGSQARTGPFAADIYSDIDLNIFTTDRDAFAHRRDWFEAFGEVWMAYYNVTDEGNPEARAVYAGGRKVDFDVFELAEFARVAAGESLPINYMHGAHILVDKDGQAAAALEAFTPPPAPTLTAKRYRVLCDSLWYQVISTAKQVARGDLWIAHARMHAMRQNLLETLEWAERAKHGPDYDTFLEGRYAAHWMNPTTYAALGDLYPGFDVDECGSTLEATLAVFREAAQTIAGAYGFAYPGDLEANVTATVRSMLNGTYS